MYLLRFFPLPSAYSRCRTTLGGAFLYHFLSAWLAAIPKDAAWRKAHWSVCAMFAMVNLRGDVACIPVRRPMRPSS